MKVSKIVKWIILVPIIVFFVVWIGTLVKNRIVTELHRDEISKLRSSYSEFLPKRDWYRILSYSETEIEIYFVRNVDSDPRDYRLGGVITFRRDSDGKWYDNFGGNYLWSGEGSADEYIWPYWYHYITH